VANVAQSWRACARGHGLLERPEAVEPMQADAGPAGWRVVKTWQLSSHEGSRAVTEGLASEHLRRASPRPRGALPSPSRTLAVLGELPRHCVERQLSRVVERRGDRAAEEENRSSK
jgi:hypothetical protein